MWRMDDDKCKLSYTPTIEIIYSWNAHIDIYFPHHIAWVSYVECNICALEFNFLFQELIFRNTNVGDCRAADAINVMRALTWVICLKNNKIRL